MSDLISRQDAIEVLMETIAPPSVTLDTLVMRIDALPSAEAIHKPDYSYEAGMVRRLKEALSAESVQGGWIDIDNYYRTATCSHCHKVTMFEKWGEYIRPYNFCPNCGADMRGGKDDER